MTEVYVVTENQYDANIMYPFKEVLGVFSTSAAANAAVHRIKEQAQQGMLPNGVSKITYYIEQFRTDDF